MASQAFVGSMIKEIIQPGVDDSALFHRATLRRVAGTAARMSAPSTISGVEKAVKLERWSNGMTSIGVSALQAPFTAVFQHSINSIPYTRPSVHDFRLDSFT